LREKIISLFGVSKSEELEKGGGKGRVGKAKIPGRKDGAKAK